MFSLSNVHVDLQFIEWSHEKKENSASIEFHEENLL